MNKRLSKIITYSILPFLLSLSLIGTGFSIWLFEKDGNNINRSIDINLTNIGNIGKLYKNYDPNIFESDESNKTNYLIVNETKLEFLYPFYIHFDFNKELPTTGKISFYFDIEIDSIGLKLPDDFPKTSYSDDTYLSLKDMINIWVYGTSNTLSLNETNLNETGSINNITYYKNKVTTSYKWIENLSIDQLNTNKYIKYNEEEFYYLILPSDSQFEIFYKTTYLSYKEEYQKIILEYSRIIMNNTSTKITYSVIYTI